MHHAYLNEIATAVPAHQCQQEFIDALPAWVGDPATAQKLRAIALRSGIERRFTVLERLVGPMGSGAFYERGKFPGTGRRMAVYQREAPPLALKAARALLARGVEPAAITHLVITSCTGFYAPGLDVDLIRLLGLSPRVGRTLIGFMGCQAGITGLRAARDTVRADPAASVLMLNLELCSLHLQEDAPLDRLISSLLFSDGCAASLISSAPHGFRLDEFTTCLSLADADKMAWRIGDQGFAMTLDAGVPERIRDYLLHHPELLGRASADPRAVWAIHPGGRAILEAVRAALGLSPEQVDPSRRVLAAYGNMSSASVMFVFEELARAASATTPQCGGAIAFGPGLTMEAMEFTHVPRPRPATALAPAAAGSAGKSENGRRRAQPVVDNGVASI